MGIVTDFDQTVEQVRITLTELKTLQSAELFVRYQKKLTIESTHALEEKSRGEESILVALSLYRDGKVVAGSLDSAEAGRLKAFIHDLDTQLAIGAPAAVRPGKLEFAQHHIDFVDETFQRIPVSEKLQRVKNLQTSLLKSDGQVKRALKNCYVEYYRKDWLWVLGSQPLLAERNWAELHAGVWTEKESECFLVEDSLYRTHYYDIDWSGFAKRFLVEAARKQGLPQKIEAGEYAAVLSNKVMLPVLKFFGETISGDFLLRGESPFSQTLPEKSFSPSLYIYDDPHMPKTVGCRLWDAQGQATARRDFIKDGKLLSFAHTRESADFFETRTTGHAVREIPFAQVKVGFHNLVLEPGPKDFIDLVRELPDGVLLSDLQEIISTDHRLGEIRLKCGGMLIEGGQEKKYFENLNVKIGLRDFFARIKSVGRDLKWAYRMAAPSLSVTAIEVLG